MRKFERLHIGLNFAGRANHNMTFDFSWRTCGAAQHALLAGQWTLDIRHRSVSTG